MFVDKTDRIDLFCSFWFDIFNSLSNEKFSSKTFLSSNVDRRNFLEFFHRKNRFDAQRREFFVFCSNRNDLSKNFSLDFESFSSRRRIFDEFSSDEPMEFRWNARPSSSGFDALARDDFVSRRDEKFSLRRLLFGFVNRRTNDS